MKLRSAWLVATAIIIVMGGTIYTAVQQTQRLGANMPQIQLAEDTANALNAGARPTMLVGGKLDMSKSLAPFTNIYDKNGHLVIGAGFIGNSIPRIPFGVLTSADNKPYNFVTWQPQSNVRIAAVSVSANSYYVLSGRSLTEVEKNENTTFQLVLFGTSISIGILWVGYVLACKKDGPKKRRKHSS